MEQLLSLRRTVKPDDLPIIFKRAFKSELDHNILAQISKRGRCDSHRIFNTKYARYFTLLAEKLRLLGGNLESFEYLQAGGLEQAQSNIKFSARVIATANREARIHACEELGQLFNPNEIWLLPLPAKAGRSRRA